MGRTCLVGSVSELQKSDKRGSAQGAPGIEPRSIFLGIVHVFCAASVYVKTYYGMCPQRC